MAIWSQCVGGSDSISVLAASAPSVSVSLLKSARRSSSLAGMTILLSSYVLEGVAFTVPE